jgi:hypothetical protein
MNIDILIDVTMVTQECNNRIIPAFNATNVVVNVDTDYMDIYFPEGNFWVHFIR